MTVAEDLADIVAKLQHVKPKVRQQVVRIMHQYVLANLPKKEGGKTYNKLPQSPFADVIEKFAAQRKSHPAGWYALGHLLYHESVRANRKNPAEQLAQVFGLTDAEKNLVPRMEIHGYGGVANHPGGLQGYIRDNATALHTGGFDEKVERALLERCMTHDSGGRPRLADWYAARTAGMVNTQTLKWMAKFGTHARFRSFGTLGVAAFEQHAGSPEWKARDFNARFKFQPLTLEAVMQALLKYASGPDLERLQVEVYDAYTFNGPSYMMLLSGKRNWKEIVQQETAAGGLKSKVIRHTVDLDLTQIDFSMDSKYVNVHGVRALGQGPPKELHLVESGILYLSWLAARAEHPGRLALPKNNVFDRVRETYGVESYPDTTEAFRFLHRILGTEQESQRYTTMHVQQPPVQMLAGVR